LNSPFKEVGIFLAYNLCGTIYHYHLFGLWAARLLSLVFLLSIYIIEHCHWTPMCHYHSRQSCLSWTSYLICPQVSELTQGMMGMHHLESEERKMHCSHGTSDFEGDFVYWQCYLLPKETILPVKKRSSWNWNKLCLKMEEWKCVSHFPNLNLMFLSCVFFPPVNTKCDMKCQ
jgi:hypothetical protein